MIACFQTIGKQRRTKMVQSLGDLYNVQCEEMEDDHYCPKCGIAWAIHDDDGSCPIENDES